MIKYLDYLIIYLIIAFSANQFFMQEKVLYVIFIHTRHFSSIKKRRFSTLAVYYFISRLMVLQLGQFFTFNFFSLNSFISIVSLYLMGYFGCAKVHDFDKKYVNLVYFFAVLSLFNFALMFVPGYEELQL